MDWEMTEKDVAAGLTTSDKVYGAIAIVAVVLALWFLVRGGPADTSALRITILDPRPGVTLTQPVTITFDAHTPLRADGTDTTTNRHVHVDAGGAMLMPGPNDVRPVSGTTYRWTLSSLPAGAIWLRAYWSDASHRPIPGPTADSVRVTIR